MDFDVKFRKSCGKNASKNDAVFKFVFLSILGRFGEGFGSVLGGGWTFLAPLGPLLSVIFWCLYLEWSSKVLLEASGLDIGWILGGLGRILGGFGEGFGRAWEGFSSILGDSGLSWTILGYWGIFG